MNRTRLLLVGVLASGALLVPTGAFSPSGTDRVTGDLTMAPSDGPNGRYAVLNDDDEIELLLTDANPYIDGGGVNDGTITPLHDVFTITYTGDEYARVWLTDDATDVRFYRGDDPDDSLEGRSNSVVLGPDETLSVGVLVDTRGDDDVESIEEFTVNARLATSTDQEDVSTESVDEDETDTPPESTTPTPIPPRTESPTATPETETTNTETISESENVVSDTGGGPAPTQTAVDEAVGPSERGSLNPLALVLVILGAALSLVVGRLYRRR